MARIGPEGFRSSALDSHLPWRACRWTGAAVRLGPVTCTILPPTRQPERGNRPARNITAFTTIIRAIEHR